MQSITKAAQRLFTIENQIQQPFFITMRSSTESPVIVEHLSQYFIRITLNRPKQLNAFNLEMTRILQPFINSCLINPNIKGKGKSFCAGGDLKGLYYGKMSSEPEKQHILEHYCREEYTLAFTLATMKAFQISIFDGYIMGGGVGLSGNSTIKIATENSVFAMPEGKIGFFTDVGGGHILSKLRKNIGMYMGMTSQYIYGQELVQVGFANYYVLSKNIKKLEQTLLQNVKCNTTLEEIHQLIIPFTTEIQQKQYKNEELINTLFQANTFQQLIENLQNFNNQFAKQTISQIYQQNAISVRVSFEVIKRASLLSLKEDLIMEFRITKRFFEGNDFYEGIRALIIEKNNNPKWTYKSPLDVPEEIVQKHFELLPNHIQELQI